MKKIKNLAVLILIVLILLPSLTTMAADKNEELDLDIKAGIIVETNTGKVIYEKEAEKQNYPASVTKILTAILVLENCDLNETAIASSKALSNIPPAYVVTPLYVGEEMRVEDLLYALMLKSANDAAYVLAEHVGGSTEGFAEMMNKKAEEIGCKNSHFVNPNGIHDDNHYTTAYDMYLISKYAMQNEEFVKIVSTYKYTLPKTNKYKAEDRVMENTNSFVNPDSKYFNENVKGIKTGTTTQAGNCLITSSSKDGMDFINVVLGAKTSDSKFSETEKMVEYEFGNYEYVKLYNKNDIIQTIEVNKATKDTKVLNLIISDDIVPLLEKTSEDEKIEPTINLKENITAPIEQGQELGTISLNIGGIEYNAKLLASNNVEKKTYYKEVAIIGGVIVIMLALIIISKKSKKNKKRRKRKLT